MPVCSLDHFHHFYLLIYQLKWYVGEAGTEKHMENRFKERAKKWSIPLDGFDFIFHTKLEVPKYQTPRTCEQGLKDTVARFIEQYVPSAYNFSCANLKECAPVSYHDLFNINSIVCCSGLYKGKALKDFINSQFPNTIQKVKSLSPKPLNIEYGKSDFPSAF
jgi:hypothetical protein